MARTLTLAQRTLTLALATRSLVDRQAVSSNPTRRGAGRHLACRPKLLRRARSRRSVFGRRRPSTNELIPGCGHSFRRGGQGTPGPARDRTRILSRVSRSRPARSRHASEYLTNHALDAGGSSSGSPRASRRARQRRAKPRPPSSLCATRPQARTTRTRRVHPGNTGRGRRQFGLLQHDAAANAWDETRPISADGLIGTRLRVRLDSPRSMDSQRTAAQSKLERRVLRAVTAFCLGPVPRAVATGDATDW